MQLPPGYAVHPQNPAFMYNVANPADVRPIAAAPAPTPPMAAPLMVATVPAAQAAPSYGTVDVSKMVEDSKTVFDRSGRIYINLPKTPSSIGESVFTVVRILPPWRADLHQAYVKYAEHRLSADLAANAGQRRFVYAMCYESSGGPGNCPLCEVLRADTTGDGDMYKPRGKYVMQGLQLDALDQHFNQVMDPATGAPLVGHDGGPVWEVLPGIIRMPPTLFRAVTTFFEEKGDATHPQTGYALKLIKKKKGAGDMEVEYAAMDLPPSPLEPQLMPVLANLIDLRAELHYYSQAEMADMAQRIAAKITPQAAYAPPAGGLAPLAGVPMVQSQMMPPTMPGTPPAVGAPPAPIAMPPMPGAVPAVPAAPGVAPAPPMPMAVPPSPAAVPAAVPPAPPMPAGLPAPTAPGGIPQAVPAPVATPPLPGVVPPGPPPGPGVPSAVQPPAPPAGMPTEQFEQSMDGGQDPIPF